MVPNQKRLQQKHMWPRKTAISRTRSCYFWGRWERKTGIVNFKTRLVPGDSVFSRPYVPDACCTVWGKMMHPTVWLGFSITAITIMVDCCQAQRSYQYGSGPRGLTKRRPNLSGATDGIRFREEKATKEITPELGTMWGRKNDSY